MLSIKNRNRTSKKLNLLIAKFIKYIEFNNKFNETTVTDFLCATLFKQLKLATYKYTQNEESQNGSDFHISLKNEKNIRAFQAKKISFQDGRVYLRLDTIDRFDSIEKIAVALHANGITQNDVPKNLLRSLIERSKLSQLELQYWHSILSGHIPHFLIYNSRPKISRRKLKETAHTIIITNTQDLFTYLDAKDRLQSKLDESEIEDILKFSYDFSLQKILDERGFFFIGEEKRKQRLNYLNAQFNKQKAHVFIQKMKDKLVKKSIAYSKVGIRQFPTEEESKAINRILEITSKACENFDEGTKYCLINSTYLKE